MLYEMLTGRRAFKRDTPVQTMAAIVDMEPEPLAELCPGAPIAVVKIVERCLAKNPANRYGSTSDLARDLHEVQWTPGSRASRSGVIIRRVARRSRGWIAAAALVMVVAALAIALFMNTRTDAPLAQARALLDRFDKPANVDTAIDLLVSTVSARPKDPAPRTMLAEAYWRKFEYNPSDSTLASRAGEHAGTALTLDRSYAPVHVVLAMINFGQGRYDGALGEAQEAISLDPGLSPAWRERGRVHFRLGKREEAEKDFLQLGDRAKALDWLGQAIKAGHSLKRIERSPWLKDLRNDERYARLRNRAGG
jgi:tetratricopeptide (TPR) repeat protein